MLMLRCLVRARCREQSAHQKTDACAIQTSVLYVGLTEMNQLCQFRDEVFDNVDQVFDVACRFVHECFFVCGEIDFDEMCKLIRKYRDREMKQTEHFFKQHSYSVEDASLFTPQGGRRASMSMWNRTELRLKHEFTERNL